ncbi:hypothetical protein [Nocardia alni]|uniref:hypothetical protein n=1 Tax=Nocardia alni TaxID=2815723 RepID=UPI001C22B2AF|nr:hypothetical protein [Nocardia alni]
MSIGTVNSIWATTSDDRERPAVRVRRTAVTFDSAGGPRIGGLPRFAPVVTDFADLTNEVEPVVLGGRIWTSADLVAAVATHVVDAVEPDADPVITYPACYSERPVERLRHALDWAGADGAVLMPEPVAAVEWLDAEYGVSDNGVTLVYDLGGNSLDIAVIRTEADRDERGVLGRALRSHDYGGRPLGAILARYARALSPGVPSPVSKVVPAADTTRLRTWNVRNSLRLVRRCVHATGLTLQDVDRVLLVGGAARPVEVARVLAELDRPVVMSPDPAHTVAVGAALASARLADFGAGMGRYARGAAVLSSAAVASALAMSAATMLGGGPVGADGPVVEIAPALAGPAESHTADTPRLDGVDAIASGAPAADVQLTTYSTPSTYSPVVQRTSVPAVARVESSFSTHGNSQLCTAADNVRPRTYADPAQFTNPLPFITTSDTSYLAPFTGSIPSISLPSIAQTSIPAAAQPVSSSSAAASASSPPGGTSTHPVSAPVASNAGPASGTTGSNTGTASANPGAPASGIGPTDSTATDSSPGTGANAAPGVSNSGPTSSASSSATSPGAETGGPSSTGWDSSGSISGVGDSAGGGRASGGPSSAGGGPSSAGGSFGGAGHSSSGGSHAGSAGGGSMGGGSHGGSAGGGSHGGSGGGGHH